MKTLINKIIWLSFLVGSLSMALTPLPLYWQQISANGSSVKLRGNHHAIFKIVRKNSGHKTNLDTHGYAYLLSQAIPLTESWERIVFEGEWWQEAARKNNYEEMVLAVYASYPPLLHGKKRENITLQNYIEVSYDTWNRFIYFRESGKEGKTKKHSMRRTIPLQPTPFRLVIERIQNSDTVQWRFFEKENGQWQLLHQEKVSHFFEGCDQTKVFWKIGA